MSLNGVVSDMQQKIIVEIAKVTTLDELADVERRMNHWLTTVARWENDRQCGVTTRRLAMAINDALNRLCQS